MIKYMLAAFAVIFALMAPATAQEKKVLMYQSMNRLHQHKK
jgi:hypothetical protein